MFYAIFFIACLVIAVVLLITGWGKRPANKPNRTTGLGWITLVLGIASVILFIPAVTAPLSITLAGVSAITGALSITKKDTSWPAIAGLVVVSLPILVWIVFLIAEVVYPH